MKNLTKLLGLVVTLAGLIVGCDSPKDEYSTPNPREINVTITSNNNTRTSVEKIEDTYIIKWDDTDTLAVWGFTSSDTLLGANTPFALSAKDDNGVASFSGTLTDPAAGEPVTARYYAYYPYLSTNLATFASYDSLNLVLSMPALQYPTLGSFDEDADLLVGYSVSTTAPVGKVAGGGDLNFAFHRVGAVTEFSVKDIPSAIARDDYVETVTLDFGTAVAGGVFVEVSDADPVASPIDTLSVSTVTLNYAGKNIPLDDDFKMWWQMLPVEISGSIGLEILTASHVITKTLDPTDSLDFRRNKVNRATVNLASATVADRPEPFTPFTVDFEGDFAFSSEFKNTSDEFPGPAGRQWGILSGTVSTNAVINGAQSLQLRFQKSSPNPVPHAYTDFDIVGLRSVSFWATYGGGTYVAENLRLDYSTDGGDNWVEGQSFTLTATPVEYSYTLPATVLATDAVRIRFTTTDTAPTAVNFRRYVIDDVSFSD
ncbi:MAG: fimbrillin family protein [Rikenellaceae bacterium]|jgi:hypothetical protein|nr:fimbrillin family protein [Rikenellaceae bacterium]